MTAAQGSLLTGGCNASARIALRFRLVHRFPPKASLALQFVVAAVEVSRT